MAAGCFELEIEGELSISSTNYIAASDENVENAQNEVQYFQRCLFLETR